jgi:hypothetical protein
MLAKSKVLFAVFAIFIAYLAFLFTGSAVNSISGNFTVTPDTVYLNWTGTSINLISNNQSVVMAVVNTTTSIAPQYFITGFYVATSDALYPGFLTEEYANCFTSITGGGMKFIVQNASSGIYTNMTDELNATNSTIYNLTAYPYCPPGYYNGTFNVTRNATSDWANLTTHIVIPISADNTFNETTSKAGFKGMFPYVDNAYHSYYFSTNQVANITGVTLNLTWTDYSKDIDVFLFNSTGSLLGKGIERSGSEAIAYVALPAASDMWQIKIFGNISSQANYTGWLYFTTLNATNASNPNQKITSLDFGSLDPNATSSQINYTLNNTDTRAWDGVMESKELYHVDIWPSQTQSGYYALFVPHFAEKVKVKIEWTGPDRWKLVVNDSSRNLIGNSSNKYYNDNMSNVVK